MKTILVPLLGDDSDTADLSTDAALGAAHLIAKRFTGHIEGLFVQPLPLPDIVSVDMAPQYFEEHSSYWVSNAKRNRNRFHSFMARRDVALADVGGTADEVTAQWHEDEGDRDRIIGSLGRLFDLIVIPRTSPETPEGCLSACEAALFESGRPVILAPPAPLDSIGRTVLISWNGSTETARTIGLGMPLLGRADSITVLSVHGASGGMVAGPTGDQVAAHLVRNGLKATARTVQAKGRTSGATVLEEAAALGADLIVKGAYTHNRLRQIIFGGTTRQVLTEATLPVLIAH